MEKELLLVLSEKACKYILHICILFDKMPQTE